MLKKKMLNSVKKILKKLYIFILDIKSSFILKKIKLLFNKKILLNLIFIKIYFSETFEAFKGIRFNFNAKYEDKENALNLVKYIHKNILTNPDNLDLKTYYLLLKEYSSFLSSFEKFFSGNEFYNYVNFENFICKVYEIDISNLDKEKLMYFFEKLNIDKLKIHNTISGELEKVNSKILELDKQLKLENINLENDSLISSEILSDILNKNDDILFALNDIKLFHLFFNSFCYTHYKMNLISNDSHDFLIKMFEVFFDGMEFLLITHLNHLFDDPEFFLKKVEFFFSNFKNIDKLSDFDIIFFFNVLYKYKDQFYHNPKYVVVYKRFFDIALERNLFNNTDILASDCDGTFIYVTADTALKVYEKIKTVLDLF